MKTIIYIWLMLTVLSGMQNNASSQIYCGGKDDGFTMFQFSAIPNKIKPLNENTFVEIEFYSNQMVIANRHHTETAFIRFYSILGHAVYRFQIPPDSRETVCCDKDKFIIIMTTCGKETKHYKISLN